MRRMIAVGMAGLLLGTAVPGAADQGKSKKHKAKESTTAAVSVSWSTHDLQIVRTHYAPQYRNLPPGLQKKYARTGQLPPGWRKKMKPFPAALERDCAPLPAGYRRGVIDAHAVIYDSRGVIIDVAILF